MAITSSDILESLFRHKLKIIFIPLVAAIGTIGILLFFPRTYRSEARLFLQVGRESMGMDPAANTGGPTVGLIQSNRDEEVKSAIQVVGSRGVISKVVDEVTPEYVLNAAESTTGKASWVKPIKDGVSSFVKLLKDIDPIDDTEEAIIEIEENLKVEAERNSTVLSITLDAKSAEAAQKVLAKLVEVYKSEHLRIHRNPDSNDFLAEQTSKLHEQWMLSKDELSKAKTKTGVLTVAGRRSNLETQLQSIELELLKNSQELGNVAAKMGENESQLGKTAERQIGVRKSVPNNGADLMREELYQSQIRLQDLKSRLTEGHPLLVTTTRQIDEAKKILALESDKREERNDDINPIYQELKTDRARQQTFMAGLQASREKLIDQKMDIQKAMESFNGAEIEIDRLEQNEEISRSKFTQYNRSLEEARMNKALEESQISSVSVAQEPTLAKKPVSPSKLLVLLAGSFLALAGVVASVLLAEKLDDRVRTEAELAEIGGVPVLTSVYENPENKKLLLR